MPNYPEAWKQLDVALCHDWLTGMRGGERVLEILCEGFPHAGLHTLIHNRNAVSDIINAHASRTSYLDHFPGIASSYRYFLPCFPSAISTMKPVEADLLISTSHCVAKSLRSTPNTRHLCYCFTPMRYAWTFYEEYFGSSPVKALIAKPMLALLRRWDKRTASRVTRFVAISEHVRKRIQNFYERDADVVYPPVDTERCCPGTPASSVAATPTFDLIVSALVPYKRVDLAVEAYNQSGRPLRIVGTGGHLQALKQMAAPNVQFLEWQNDDAVLELYRTCRLLVFPGEEDFGIVPLEAQACGKPVVAYAKGGALETVRRDVSGIFFSEQTANALNSAVTACAEKTWNPEAIRTHAEQFGNQNFVDSLAQSIDKCLRSPTP